MGNRKLSVSVRTESKSRARSISKGPYTTLNTTFYTYIKYQISPKPSWKIRSADSSSSSKNNSDYIIPYTDAIYVMLRSLLSKIPLKLPPKPYSYIKYYRLRFSDTSNLNIKEFKVLIEPSSPFGQAYYSQPRPVLSASTFYHFIKRVKDVFGKGLNTIIYIQYDQRNKRKQSGAPTELFCMIGTKIYCSFLFRERGKSRL
jgi:hypothetical protein